jgi:hypothetical protein
VREYAAWEQAIKQAEQEWERDIPKRGKYSSFHRQLRRFRPVLHFCAAFEMAREGPSPTIEAMMFDAMNFYNKLHAWHVKRVFPGRRNDYLAGDIFWRWEGITYDDNNGIPDIAIPFERLVPHGKSGRPRKPTQKM